MPNQIHELLSQYNGGDSAVPNELTDRLYHELRAIAARQLRLERTGHTLQPTALVHEAFVRLAEGRPVEFQDRAHFLAIAAKLMRQILINHAKRRTSAKRGGGARRVPLQTDIVEVTDRRLDWLVIDDALQRLAERSERQSRILELRFFSGMTVREVAHVLSLSITTVEDEWYGARAWLSRELSG